MRTAGSESWRAGSASITELAAAEKIDRSYLCRVLRLTLLAPELVEAILEGRQAEDVTLPGLMKGFSVEWERKSRILRHRKRVLTSNTKLTIHACHPLRFGGRSSASPIAHDTGAPHL